MALEAVRNIDPHARPQAG